MSYMYAYVFVFATTKGLLAIPIGTDKKISIQKTEIVIRTRTATQGGMYVHMYAYFE